MEDSAPPPGRVEAPDRIILTSGHWGLPAGTALPLFHAHCTCAWRITLADRKALVLGTYPDGSPAIVSHKLGKGRVITFAANPFAPQVIVEPTPWPAAFKGLQLALGCKVDQPIWHFAIPAPAQ